MGRPSSPPLALTSSTQICLARRLALPDEASPPVSETRKPILIGSAASGGAIALHVHAREIATAARKPHAARLCIALADETFMGILPGPAADDNAGHACDRSHVVLCCRSS